MENQNGRETWINNRAYELWQHSGQPEGQQHEHWGQATKEWEAGAGKTAEPDDPWEEET